MPTQQERRATTRAALLVAARAVFTEKGFAATGREEIAERAGVTRGALYHHFDSKQAAFEAVAAELDASLADTVVRAALRGKTPEEQIRLSCRAYLEACAEPSVARILLGEAAAVLGPDWVRRSNESACVALLTPALERVAVPGNTHIAAQLILGMLNEAATIVAASKSPKAEVRKVFPTVEAFLERLLSRGD